MFSIHNHPSLQTYEKKMCFIKINPFRISLHLSVFADLHFSVFHLISQIFACPTLIALFLCGGTVQWRTREQQCVGVFLCTHPGVGANDREGVCVCACLSVVCMLACSWEHVSVMCLRNFCVIMWRANQSMEAPGVTIVGAQNRMLEYSNDLSLFFLHLDFIVCEWNQEDNDFFCSPSPSPNDPFWSIAIFFPFSYQMYLNCSLSLPLLGYFEVLVRRWAVIPFMAFRRRTLKKEEMMWRGETWDNESPVEDVRPEKNQGGRLKENKYGMVWQPQITQGFKDGLLPFHIQSVLYVHCNHNAVSTSSAYLFVPWPFVWVLS